MGSVSPPSSQLPYWHVNVPEAERTPDCPIFLTNLLPRDLTTISTPDSEYTRQTWPYVQDLVRSNQLQGFRRVPSDLRRYLGFNYNLKQKYGSVMAFVVKERLKWDDDWRATADAGDEAVKAQLARRFEDEANWKILWNDWPYGIDERIVHLVVWTKFELEEIEGTDDLKPEVFKALNDFVNEKFVSRLGKENVIWFKNWKSLKSIHAVEHFHVMLFDPPAAFVDEVTKGDVPLFRIVQ